MAKLAHFGTGMLGSGMVEAMLRRGNEVTVWNRTREKTKPLEALGAKVCDTPAEAALGAERLHFTLNDDASVDAVLEACAPSLGPTTFVVDHTTTSPAGTIARHRRLAAAKVPFLHAPVFMSPQGGRDATGLMLACGPRTTFERVKDELEKMTGAVWFTGERIDLAAAYKLFGNAILFSIVGGLADVYAMAEALGIDATDAHSVFTHFKPGNSIELRGARMAKGDFAPSFDLMMARKDLRMMLEVKTHYSLAVLPSLASRFDALIAAGHGAKDYGVIAAPAVERWPAERNDPFALLES
ncbi:MAG: NAD(P)-dependent oxidoreductase, partial [Polyangiaceae bacterium]